MDIDETSSYHLCLVFRLNFFFFTTESSAKKKEGFGSWSFKYWEICIVSRCDPGPPHEHTVRPRFLPILQKLTNNNNNDNFKTVRLILYTTSVQYFILHFDSWNCRISFIFYFSFATISVKLLSRNHFPRGASLIHITAKATKRLFDVF